MRFIPMTGRRLSLRAQSNEERAIEEQIRVRRGRLISLVVLPERAPAG
jgi:hypothetical protein